MKPDSPEKSHTGSRPEWQIEDPGSFSILDLLLVLLRSKRLILIHFLAVVGLAVGVSFIIPKKFKATTVFLPPSGENFSLPAMAFGLGLNMSNESEFTPQQIESLLDSRLILEQIIAKYDLMTVYKTKKKKNNLEAALKILRRNVKLRAATEAGLTHTTVINYSLSVIDKDRNRSAAIANDMIELLNRAMEELSHQQEDYTVRFIHARLDSVGSTKAALQKDMAAFQKTNKIYSPEMKEQVLASVSTIAELQKQKIMSEIERDLLLLDREKGNRDVRFVERKIAQFGSRIKQLESGRQADVLPGLDFAVDVAYKYLEMVKEHETLLKLELLLRQQYEEARIKNARRAPVVRVIDRAVPPQWKNSPKKLLVVGCIVGVYMVLLIVYLLTRHGLDRSSESTRRKVAALRSSLRF